MSADWTFMSALKKIFYGGIIAAFSSATILSGSSLFMGLIHHPSDKHFQMLHCKCLPRLRHNTKFYTTHTNFSTKYLMTCKVYTDVGGLK